MITVPQCLSCGLIKPVCLDKSSLLKESTLQQYYAFKSAKLRTHRNASEVALSDRFHSSDCYDTYRNTNQIHARIIFQSVQ